MTLFRDDADTRAGPCTRNTLLKQFSLHIVGLHVLQMCKKPSQFFSFLLIFTTLCELRPKHVGRSGGESSLMQVWASRLLLATVSLLLAVETRAAWC